MRVLMLPRRELLTVEEEASGEADRTMTKSGRRRNASRSRIPRDPFVNDRRRRKVNQDPSPLKVAHVTVTSGVAMTDRSPGSGAGCSDLDQPRRQSRRLPTERCCRHAVRRRDPCWYSTPETVWSGLAQAAALTVKAPGKRCRPGAELAVIGEYRGSYSELHYGADARAPDQRRIASLLRSRSSSRIGHDIAGASAAGNGVTCHQIRVVLALERLAFLARSRR